MQENNPMGKLMELKILQEQLLLWLDHNFPETNSDMQLKGVVEELGELAHADLKHQQGIRGYKDVAKTKAEIMDAVGDINMYLMNYCNKMGIDYAECILFAWNTIKQRDWIKYPDTGLPPETVVEQQEERPHWWKRFINKIIGFKK